MLVQRVRVSRLFNWLLPLQVAVAIVAIQSAVQVFGIDIGPSILALVATILLLLLGLYLCLAWIRIGSWHLYVVSLWLVVCAGLWCGPLYFFAQCLSITKLPDHTSPRRRDGQSLPLVWSIVGCVMSALSVFVDLMLLGVLILFSSKPEPKTSKDSYESSFVTTTTDTAPQLPPLAYLHNHRISFPYRGTSPTPPLSPKPTFSPVLRMIPSNPTRTRQLNSNPNRDLDDDDDNQPPFNPTANLNLNNRITLILRLCALQHLPQGNWSYTPELGALLNTWAKRDIVMAPTAHGLTALAHACLIDLTQTIWTAQREGRENQVLSAEEMWSLEEVGWDLGWVSRRIEVAGRWLRNGGGR